MLRFKVWRLRRNEDALRSKNASCPAPVSIHRSRAGSDRYLKPFILRREVHVYFSHGEPVCGRSAADAVRFSGRIPYFLFADLLQNKLGDRGDEFAVRGSASAAGEGTAEDLFLHVLVAAMSIAWRIERSTQDGVEENFFATVG